MKNKNFNPKFSKIFRELREDAQKKEKNVKIVIIEQIRYTV